VGRENQQLAIINENFLPCIGVSRYRITMGTEKIALMIQATVTSSRARLPNDKNTRCSKVFFRSKDRTYASRKTWIRGLKIGKGQVSKLQTTYTLRIFYIYKFISKK
jgi:hypothetical protein